MKRLKFIDGLRGIAACMVMFYHLGNRTGLKPLTQWGYLGVGIFFVISGFVIASTLDRELSAAAIGRFFARRFVRLDIPYWVNITVTLVLGAALYRFGGPIHRYTGEQVAVHLVYLQDILGVPEINQVYWTLCLEIQFYLTLAFALWVAQRVSWRVFQGALVASIALSTLCNAGLLHSPRGLMFPYWWAFGLGAAICFWYRARMNGAALFAAFAAVSFLPFVSLEAWRITGALTGLAITGALYMKSESKWLSGNSWQFLGRISYSLYLYHALIGWEAQTFALRYMGTYTAAAFGIAVSIGVAWLAYVLIERPAVRLSHLVPLSPAQRGLSTASSAT
ncbi:MAG: acyltransferase family protein [Steroidobacteraceae bacterium]